MVLANVYVIFVNANSNQNIQNREECYHGKNERKSTLQCNFDESER
jgi:hypothetical protein